MNQKFQPRFSFIIFLSLGFLILVESVLIASGSGPRANQKTFIASEEPAFNGSMSLLLASGSTVSTDQTFQAEVVFDSAGETVAGADVIINFDPQVIQIINIGATQETFEQVFVNQQESGRVRITAYLPRQDTTQPTRLAQLTLKLLQPEKTVVGLEFLGPNATRDSNLVSQKTHQDLLGQVNSLILKPTPSVYP